MRVRTSIYSLTLMPGVFRSFYSPGVRRSSTQSAYSILLSFTDSAELRLASCLLVTTLPQELFHFLPLIPDHYHIM